MPLADAPAQQAPAQRPPAYRSRARDDRLERGIFRALNRVRSRYGLPRLRMVPKISLVAAVHSADLAANRFISHSSSNGMLFSRRVRRVVAARTVGETIIELRGSVTPRRVVRAWMRSPRHRAQLLAPGYRRVGVGRATVRGLSVVTADFASRR